MIGQPITLKIELDHMKQAIVTALHDYNGELEAEMDRQIEATIRSFNFERVVAPAVQQSVRDSVDAYFKYGNGRTIIESVVKIALDQIFSPLLVEDEQEEE